MKGKEDTRATRVNFHPKAKDIARQPMILKNPILANAVLVPRSCCNCVGSFAKFATNVPVELSRSSKNSIGLFRMLSKYICRYE